MITENWKSGAEIAELLGISIKNVENIKNRFRSEE